MYPVLLSGGRLEWTRFTVKALGNGRLQKGGATTDMKDARLRDATVSCVHVKKGCQCACKQKRLRTNVSGGAVTMTRV